MEWLPVGEKNWRYRFPNFDRIHERYRQTDRHTQRQTDSAWRHRPRFCIASRGKYYNCTQTYIWRFTVSSLFNVGKWTYQISTVYVRYVRVGFEKHARHVNDVSDLATELWHNASTNRQAVVGCRPIVIASRQADISCMCMMGPIAGRFI